MRCYICDVILSPTEIQVDKRTGEYEPCSKCRDAAYVDDDWEREGEYKDEGDEL